MSRFKITFDVGYSSSTFNDYLKVHEMNRSTGRSNRLRSSERKHAKAIWQIDQTVLAKNIWVLQVVDGHCRSIVGARVMTGPMVDQTIDLPKVCLSDHGMRDQSLTDHGTQFFAVMNAERDLNKFSQVLNVQHIIESIAHPQTLGDEIKDIFSAVPKVRQKLEKGLAG